ncbi:MAG: DUF362 domain-containing protein [Chloroflexi bacterium]|nr:DUF362 domain-containing protein [Chloroflexota bacterium]
MQLHPLLDDPLAVAVYHTAVSLPVGWDAFRRAGRELLAALQLRLDEGDKPVLKPNVTAGELQPGPDTGITTHPGFVEGLIEHLLAHGARRGQVFVVEDPHSTRGDERRSWVNTGYPAVAERTGCVLREPLSYNCVRLSVPNPRVHRWIPVQELFVAPGAVVINVPKLKTHNLAICTLSLKNLQGAIGNRDRSYCSQAWQELPEAWRYETRPRGEWMTRAIHEQWQERHALRLADAASVLTPALNVVEGIVGRDGTAFAEGRNYATGLAIAGRNMVAVDTVAAYLMGFDPRKLVCLRVASEAGLGTNDLRRLRVYSVRDGALEACADLAALRAVPPFRVITRVRGEEQDPDYAR